MVVHDLTDNEVDLLFHALSDSTRRDIVARALRSEQSVSALAEHYTMSFAAVQKHVAVLERASLITKQRRGRQQIVSGNLNAIRVASTLIDGFEQIWLARAERIGAILAEADGVTPPTGAAVAPDTAPRVAAAPHGTAPSGSAAAPGTARSGSAVLPSTAPSGSAVPPDAAPLSTTPLTTTSDQPLTEGKAP